MIEKPVCICKQVSLLLPQILFNSRNLYRIVEKPSRKCEQFPNERGCNLLILGLQLKKFNNIFKLPVLVIKGVE